MACLGKLLLHYPMTNMTEREKTSLLEDYIEDMSPYPTWAIVEACRHYRKNAENQYFPKVAVLVESLRGKCERNQMMRHNIRNILNFSTQEKPAGDNFGAVLAKSFKFGGNSA
jgi:hypothetical protein